MPTSVRMKFDSKFPCLETLKKVKGSQFAGFRDGVERFRTASEGVISYPETL